MSILIKGMEMPINCLECAFYRRTDPIYDYCCISSAIPKGYVPKDCPLVEVPPHGRLIDADALYKSYGASGNCNKCDLDAYKCQYYNEHTMMEFCELIDDAPTIIDAEEGE